MDTPLKGKYRNAKVFIRIFPSEQLCWDFVKIAKDKRSIYCRCLQDFGKGKDHEKERNYWQFSTDGVFYNRSQKEVYSKVTSGIMESVFKGNNVIVAAYGQTGSGKSLTALGLYNSEQDRGIAPRLIVDLFSYIRLKKDLNVNVFISSLEIINTRFIDLLDPKLKVRDQAAVNGVTRLLVKDENDALCILYKAEGRRQFVDKSDYESHKANFVVTLEVNLYGAENKIISKLHIVDLAGADYYGNISCSYRELFDVATGNLAKSQLEQFLLILCEDIPFHILSKQRLNTLIYYLKDSLNTESVLRFIGHIHTDLNNQMLTISMLRFAQIIKCLPPKTLASHTVENEDAVINRLQQQVQDLNAENIMQSMLLNTDLSRKITEERILHMQNVAKEYLQDATNELTILNVTDITMFLKVFKDMYNNMKLAKERQQCEIYEKAFADATARMSKSLSMKSSKQSTLKSSNSSVPKSSTQSQTTQSSRASATSKRTQTDSQISVKPVKSSLSKESKKKPSNASVEVTKEQSQLVVIPEGPPTYTQAYDLFVNSTESNYGKLSKINKACAVAASAANQEYIQEVKNLKELNQMLEKRKWEQLQAQMQEEIFAEPIVLDIKHTCLQKIIETETMIMKQQETVLKYQTDLNIALENYNRSKRNLSDAFDAFCMENFKTLIPEIQTEVDALMPTVPGSECENTLEIIPQLKHSDLQHMMLKERKKTATQRKQNTRKWVI